MHYNERIFRLNFTYPPQCFVSKKSRRQKLIGFPAFGRNTNGRSFAKNFQSTGLAMNGGLICLNKSTKTSLSFSSNVNRLPQSKLLFA